jgi:hypothetical protein
MSLPDFIAKYALWWDAKSPVPIAGKVEPTPVRHDPLIVKLVGDAAHADFRDAIGLIRRSALVNHRTDAQPELTLVVQSRPGMIRNCDIERLRHDAPLAGIVALLGTWCEGETRTGRPWPGVPRFYWYEFPAWFRRQMTLRAAGRCPDWAQCEFGAQSSCSGARIINRNSRGVIQLSVSQRETADAMTDALNAAGYAIVWHRGVEPGMHVRGAVAGVWEGAQLDEGEAAELATFCRRLDRYHTPVIGILDFPRRDRVERALECGAAAVLGKPWRIDDLLATIELHLPSIARSDGDSNNQAA